MAIVQDNGTIERETVGETCGKGFVLEMKAELTEDFNVTGGYYSYMKSEVVRGSTRGGLKLDDTDNLHILTADLTIKYYVITKRFCRT